MTAKKSVNSYCRNCSRDTKHDVLAEENESYREEYVCDYSYQIVECRGCETKSFRRVFADHESAYPVDNEWEVPQTIDAYPKFVKGHRELYDTYHLPRVVRRIYSEVLLAMQEEAKILAGLGLRGTVEAVCNDLKIAGRNLETRITKLSTSGYISKKDAERLHTIRFMGNDAAHEIKKPGDEALSVALQIIEHLLASVYILQKKSEGELDTIISEFTKFENLITESLTEFNEGDEFPLAKFLGKDLRRVKESMSDLEAELQNRINDKEFTSLSLGMVAKYNDSKHELQHYIVQ